MTDIATNNCASPSPQSRLHRLFDRNFLDYTAYVIRERAIPDIDDGLIPLTTLVRAGITVTETH